MYLYEREYLLGENSKISSSFPDTIFSIISIYKQGTHDGCQKDTE